MRLDELVTALGLTVLTPAVSLEHAVSGGYCGDLLSDVLASAHPDDLWITIQRHVNIVAVAKVVGIPAILIGKGFVPHQDVIDKASAAGIAILSGPQPVFELAGRVYQQLCPDTNGGNTDERCADRQSKV